MQSILKYTNLFSPSHKGSRLHKGLISNLRQVSKQTLCFSNVFLETCISKPIYETSIISLMGITWLWLESQNYHLCWHHIFAEKSCQKWGQERLLWESARRTGSGLQTNVDQVFPTCFAMVIPCILISGGPPNSLCDHQLVKVRQLQENRPQKMLLKTLGKDLKESKSMEEV